MFLNFKDSEPVCMFYRNGLPVSLYTKGTKEENKDLTRVTPALELIVMSSSLHISVLMTFLTPLKLMVFIIF